MIKTQAAVTLVLMEKAYALCASYWVGCVGSEGRWVGEKESRMHFLASSYGFVVKNTYDKQMQENGIKGPSELRARLGLI